MENLDIKCLYSLLSKSITFPQPFRLSLFASSSWTLNICRYIHLLGRLMMSCGEGNWCFGKLEDSPNIVHISNTLRYQTNNDDPTWCTFRTHLFNFIFVPVSATTCLDCLLRAICLIIESEWKHFCYRYIMSTWGTALRGNFLWRISSEPICSF